MNGFYSWRDEKGDHYISPIQLINTKEKKLTDKVLELDEKTKAILKDVLSTILGLGIETIVEKTVHVQDPALLNENAEIREMNMKLGHRIEELEKELAANVLPELRPVEYRTDPKEIELAVLKAKCEIYEKLVFGGVSGAFNPHKLQAV